ncbi:MAG: AI-2E family transporter [Oscillospiraceae bacterium]|nr:AI-2E family transporter [Oscillospiraceae bacterium]
MDFSSKKLRELSLWIIGTVTACVLVFLAVQNIDVVAGALKWFLGLISPLICGFAFALIFNVPMRFFEDRLRRALKKPAHSKLCRPVAFIISVLVIFGIFIGVVWLVIPELVNAFGIIIDGIVSFVDTLSGMSTEQFEQLPFGKLLLGVDWNGIWNSLQEWLKNEGGNIVNTAFGSISSLVGGVFDFVIAFIFSIYIIFSKDRLKTQFCRLIRAWLPSGAGEWIIHASSVASLNFRNFVSGQSLEAVILGLLCLFGMLIFDMPYAPMVSALVGITALIPVVGAFIGAAVGAFMILTVDPLKAALFVVFLVILQQIEGNIIYPKVMSSRVNLPSLWILAAVTVGGGLAGPLGMLLGVPVASTAYVLLKEATETRELRKQGKADITALKK